MVIWGQFGVMEFGIEHAVEADFMKALATKVRKHDRNLHSYGWPLCHVSRPQSSSD